MTKEVKGKREKRKDDEGKEIEKRRRKKAWKEGLC